MTQTITRLFDTYADASSAVAELERLGVHSDDLSIIGKRSDDRSTGDGIGDINDDGDVTRGASTGAVLGGVGGLLAGLGLLAIPGLGPIVAAGWLAAAATGAGIGAAGGAATGGIVGALKNAGHSDNDANVYSEGVRRGGTLVSARVPDDLMTEAEAVMLHYNGSDADTRGTSYRAEGWTRFDEDAAGFTRDADDNRRTGTGF